MLLTGDEFRQFPVECSHRELNFRPALFDRLGPAKIVLFATPHVVQIFKVIERWSACLEAMSHVLWLSLERLPWYSAC
jgi:hypothetical protein